MQERFDYVGMQNIARQEKKEEAQEKKYSFFSRKRVNYTHKVKENYRRTEWGWTKFSGAHIIEFRITGILYEGTWS